MKKTTLFVLSVAIAASLAACGYANQEPENTPEPPVSSVPIESDVSEAETAAVGELSYSELTESHKALFDEVSSMFDDPVRMGAMSVGDANKELDDLISSLAADGELPTNAVDLVHQYRDEFGITFPEPEEQAEFVLNDGTASQPAQGQQQNSNEEKFYQPTPEELRQMDIEAGLEPGGGIDWSLWNDEEFHQPTPEEKRQMDIEAGLEPCSDIDWSL